MKKSRFTESQIISILNKQEQGLKVTDICRKHGISDATFYNCKARYGGLSVSELVRIKELQAQRMPGSIQTMRIHISSRTFSGPIQMMIIGMSGQ